MLSIDFIFVDKRVNKIGKFPAIKRHIIKREVKINKYICILYLLAEYIYIFALAKENLHKYFITEFIEISCD